MSGSLSIRNGVWLVAAALLLGLATNVIGIRFSPEEEQQRQLYFAKMNIKDLKEAVLSKPMGLEAKNAANRGHISEQRIQTEEGQFAKTKQGAEEEYAKADSEGKQTGNWRREGDEQSTLEHLARDRSVDDVASRKDNLRRAGDDAIAERNYQDDVSKASGAIEKDQARVDRDTRKVRELESASKISRDAVKKDYHMARKDEKALDKTREELDNIEHKKANAMGQEKKAEAEADSLSSQRKDDLAKIHNEEEIVAESKDDARKQAREVSLGAQDKRAGEGAMKAPEARIQQAKRAEDRVRSEISDLDAKSDTVTEKLAGAKADAEVAEDRLQQGLQDQAAAKKREDELKVKENDETGKKNQAKAMSRKYKETANKEQNDADDAASKADDAKRDLETTEDKLQDLKRDEATLAADVKSSEDSMARAQDKVKEDERDADDAEAKEKKALDKQQIAKTSATEEKKAFVKAAKKVEEETKKIEKVGEFAGQKEEQVMLGKADKKLSHFQNVRQANMMKDNLEKKKDQMERARDKAEDANRDANAKVEETGEEVAQDKVERKHLEAALEEDKREKTEAEAEWRRRKTKLNEEKTNEVTEEEKAREDEMKEHEEKRLADTEGEKADRDRRKSELEAQRASQFKDAEEDAKERLHEVRDKEDEIGKSVAREKQQEKLAHASEERSKDEKDRINQQEAGLKEQLVGAEKEAQMQQKLLEKASYEKAQGEALESAGKKGLQFDKGRNARANQKLNEEKKDLDKVMDKTSTVQETATEAADEVTHLDANEHYVKGLEKNAMKDAHATSEQTDKDSSIADGYQRELETAQIEREGLDAKLSSDKKMKQRQQSRASDAKRDQVKHLDRAQQKSKDKVASDTVAEMAHAAKEKARGEQAEHADKRDGHAGKGADMDDLTMKYLGNANTDAGEAAAAWRDAERYGAGAPPPQIKVIKVD